jgi:hypothetical protein
MGRLILFIFFVGVSLFCSAQDTVFNVLKQKEIKGVYTDFTVDEIGNLYLVINSSQLKKLNKDGDSIAVYNDTRKFGKIHSIDPTNPFKTLVYFKDAAVIVILDRLLAVVQVIDLRKNNIPGARAIRLSYDNNIWVFDELENKIKKIDDKGKLLLESADLRNVFSQAPSFEQLFDNSRSLHLYDPKQGWFVFDYYGAFIKKYAFAGWKDVMFAYNLMIGREGNYIVAAKPGDLNYKRFSCTVCTKDLVRVQYNVLNMYILFDDRLEIYDAP